jgi:branched-chain amino acid aminotransferase
MSMSDRDGFIWFDGKMVPWRDANIHVLTHSLHYGMGVFEGIRAYKTESGPAIFRLKEHVKRLFNGTKIFQMAIPYNEEQITQAIIDVVKDNKLAACYIRPIVFIGSEKLGVSPMATPFIPRLPLGNGAPTSVRMA